MAIPFDPRPVAERQPSDVPCRIVHDDATLGALAAALRASSARAIDTETVYTDQPLEVAGPGALRVVSVATRDHSGADTAWVIDVNVIDRHRLACVLSGVAADAWNATFDARVIERDLIVPARLARHRVEPPSWWDAQLADALLHQGVSGFGYFHGLAWAAEWYLGIHADGKGTTQLSYRAEGRLTEDQIRYAAADAVETLWVSAVIRRQLEDAGLTVVCDLEQRARPLLDHMERAGLPFDSAGWEAELAEMANRREAILGHLAEMTGGGQGSLFSKHLEPSWNPGSEAQTKAMLNLHAPDRVAAWARRVHGEERGLVDSDPLPADVLVDIGGELCEQLLAYRDLTKLLTTYGESFREHVREDGRIHPEYLQVVGTNTGRLASRNPNAQNLAPRMKRHVRPASDDRMFVHADLSQAELRFVAQVSGDANLRQAFVDGVDVHVATAERMFQVDMGSLRTTDPVRYEELRSKSKRINFGIVYGQRGSGLARSLTHSGVETSESEGRKLLDAYLAAYPGVARWVDERDQFISELSDSAPEMDWPLTLQLHEWWPELRRVSRDFREMHRRWPTVEEVHEALIGTSGLTIAEAAWTLSFNAPIALKAGGNPFGFASHTLAGRRQQFTMHTEGLLASAAAIVMRSPKPGPAEVRRLVTTQGGVTLESLSSVVRGAGLEKLLEDRPLRRAIVEQVTETMGPDATSVLLDGALCERISRMANAYRNAPIQGGVADVMLDAYGMLHERLVDRDGAAPVQTVHDSVVIECDREHAADVATTVKAVLEEAMQRWCPDVPAVADTDVRRSLSEADVEFRIG
ncbi:MAG: DNA polymerase [Acidimicrobiia bacterium]|nr:DNA polymerase [Acidimicrobiia bacterium]